MRFSRHACAIAFFSTTLLLSACGGGGGDSYVGVDPNHGFISDRAYTLDTLQNASSIRVMTYNMPYVTNMTKKATALVILPKGTRPATGWRTVVWEHGTVGGGDACAPSNNLINADFEILADSLLAQGYMIVAPDYEGLGTAGMHPFLHLKSSANSSIYAMRAVKAHYQGKINNEWMAVGQSQGGHAALATAEYVANDSTYQGTIATAPPSNLSYVITVLTPALLQDLNTLDTNIAKEVYAELLAYTALTAASIRSYETNFDYGTIFQDRSKLIAELAEGTTGENGLCLDPLISRFSEDISLFLLEDENRKLLDYPGLKTGFEQTPTVASFLTRNEPATKKLEKPLLVIQGELDTAVPYLVTEALVQRQRNLGKTDLTYDFVPNAGHSEAIVLRNAEVINFIKTYMSPN